MAKSRERKFYQTESFKALYQKWVTGTKKPIAKDGKVKIEIVQSKLAKSGFQDIENPSGVLKTKNKRTQAYRQQEELQRISSALMAYICHPSIHLSTLEKQILELYSEGAYRKTIMKTTGKSHQTVWKCVKKHTSLALGLAASEQEVTVCPLA